MVKRLPYFVLALLFGLASSVLIGGQVCAASPIIYDGTVTWAIARRNSYASGDFNYGIRQEPLPRYGSVGTIYPELCGIPSNRTSTTYSSIPSFVSVQSRELRDNGGYIYLAFCIGYATDVSTSSQNISFTYSNIKQYISRSGSLAYAVSNGTSLSRSQNFLGASSSNTGFEVEFSNVLDLPGAYLRGITRYDGGNFPHVAYMLGSGQTADDIGASYATVYGYGDTSTSWKRTYFYSCRIEVPAQTDSSLNTVWIDLSSAITGTFKSAGSTEDLIDVDGNLIDSVTCARTNCVYLCPIYCYASSSGNYDEVQSYLAQILNAIENIPGQEQAPASVRESYAALGSQAREEAARAASQMAANVPSYNAADYDVDTYVDSHALDQFKQTVGFLSHTKILPIVMLVFILATVAYVFFGKKGG